MQCCRHWVSPCQRWKFPKAILRGLLDRNGFPSPFSLHFLSVSQINSAIPQTIGGQTETVERRFNEFVDFRKDLKKAFPALVIPGLPEAEMTLTTAGKTSQELTEFRKREFERFLKRITANPDIVESPFAKSFLLEHKPYVAFSFLSIFFPFLSVSLFFLLYFTLSIMG